MELEIGSSVILGAELFTIGFLIFIIIYVLLRLISERREHAIGKTKEKQEEKKH